MYNVAISMVRVIEAYMNEICQYANCELIDSYRIIEIEKHIKEQLKQYPIVITASFEDITTLRKEMDNICDYSRADEIELLIEELICLIKEYECSPRYSIKGEYESDSYESDYVESQVYMRKYKEYQEETFYTENKLRLFADMERANEIYDYICNSNEPVTRKMILHKFASTSLRALNMALNRKDVLSFDSIYMPAEKLQISRLAKDNMLDSLKKLTCDGDQHNVSELLEYAKQFNTDFLVEAKIANAHQLYSVIEYLYEGKFEFSRPYFGARGIELLTVEKQLKKYIYEKKDYSIRRLFDFAKMKRINVDSIVRILNMFNDEYYILDKEYLIPIRETGIENINKRDVISSIFKELLKVKCVAIRDLKIIIELPKINVHWTEWLLYSIIKKSNLNTITVTLSSNRFKNAVPIIALSGEDTVENISKVAAKYKGNDSTMIYEADNLDELDLLLEDILDISIFGGNI